MDGVLVCMSIFCDVAHALESIGEETSCDRDYCEAMIPCSHVQHCLSDVCLFASVYSIPIDLLVNL